MRASRCEVVCERSSSVVKEFPICEGYRCENKRNFVRVSSLNRLCVQLCFNSASSSFKFADRGHLRSSTLCILHQPFSSSSPFVYINRLVRHHRSTSSVLVLHHRSSTLSVPVRRLCLFNIVYCQRLPLQETCPGQYILVLIFRGPGTFSL